MRFAPIFLILFSLCFIGVADASTPFLSSSGTDSEQIRINEALESISKDGGGILYLEEGVYEITGPIYIYSNTVLTGDKNAIIRVSASSSQWFVGATGFINAAEKPLENVEIYGFQIDGNLVNLPQSYANYGTGSHNAGRAIYLQGNKNNFMSNISVHNMEIYDCYSDGIQIAYCNGAKVSNNLVSNCQHSGIFFISVKNGVIYKNEVAGITSDCVRIDNGVNIQVSENNLYSYTGPNTNGQGPRGENGLQIADEGHSAKNGGGNKPLKTANIEVFNNVFANTGWHGIWLDSTKKGVENVYIHDNIFLTGEELVTEGNSVFVDIEESKITELNPPSKEMSKKVFEGIDLLNLEFSEDGFTKQGQITPTKNWEKKGKYTQAYIFLAGYDGQISFNGQNFIPSPASECAIIQYDAKNLAENPTGQTMKIELTDTQAGDLKAKLTVKTKYKVKKYKTYPMLGKKIKVPYWDKKSETVVFTKIFSAPSQFPELGTGQYNVTVKYYNSTYNPHTLVTVEENGKQTQFPELITFIEYAYLDSYAKEYRQIGYIYTNASGYKETHFKNTSTWKFTGEKLSHTSRTLYIKGPLDLDSLKITVHTPYRQAVVTEISYSEERTTTGDFLGKMKQLFWIILFFAPFLFSISEEFKIVFGRFRG